MQDPTGELGCQLAEHWSLNMGLYLFVTEDRSDTPEFSRLSICATRIVTAKEYRLISQAVETATGVMSLEALPLSADGSLFRWRTPSDFRFPYAYAFQSTFEFLGLALVIRSDLTQNLPSEPGIEAE